MSAGGWVTMIVLLAAVLCFALWVVGRLFPVQGGLDARALLDARLASGELDIDGYRSLRSALDHSDTYARKAHP
jgi:putative membrane protein